LKNGRVLLELRVENLLLIEQAALRLDPGLNVITGETGAGKTLLTHALDLLLGGKRRSGILRPGATEAYVEGVFVSNERVTGDPELAELRERVPLDSDELVLARRVTSDGRTRAYVQGRSVSANDLRAVASRLITFYGQHEHRRLVLASAQLEILDAVCGKQHLENCAKFEQLLSGARRDERDLYELRERMGARERDLDLLEFELNEIDSAAPSESEEVELEAELKRLAAVESLMQAGWAAASALDPKGDDDTGGAVGLLAQATSEIGRTGDADPRLEDLGERCNELAYEVQELARELHAYTDSLEADPGRLAQVEERLELFGRLKRKHGGSIADVLEHAERCRAEHARLVDADETTSRLEGELQHTTGELDQLAANLRGAREQAAAKLEVAVRVELENLGMADSSFEVALGDRGESSDGLDRFGSRGADTVEFLIAPNRGVPPGYLREIASGGELSRVMLALMSIATAMEGAATVVFDEVDAGVGGNTARSVGERLKDLGSRRQVVCITHLPQVASLASRHFRVEKHQHGSAAPRAEVEQLDQQELVVELCRMLGADADDGAARQHAERLLQAA
jgi:DNA repair protein RecN (Recombination protein N)